MPEKVSPAEATRRVAAFLYLLTSLIVFPAVLMAVQDLPSLPRVTYGRSLEHVRLTYFSFETIFIGIAFIAIFLVPLWRILLSSKREINLIVALIVATMVYVVGVFVAGHVRPFSAFKSSSVCSDGYLICHPFGVYGYLMFFAIIAGIAMGRIGRNTLRPDVHVPPDQATTSLAKLFYGLLPAFLYPLVMKLEEGSASSTVLEYFGTSIFKYSDLVNILVLILFIFVYTWVYAHLFLIGGRVLVSVTSTALSTILYLAVMFLLSYVAACPVDHSAVCISRAAHGLMLVIIVSSTLLFIPSLISLGNSSNVGQAHS
jgi:hypothetical protein